MGPRYWWRLFNFHIAWVNLKFNLPTTIRKKPVHELTQTEKRVVSVQNNQDSSPNEISQQLRMKEQKLELPKEEEETEQEEVDLYGEKVLDFLWSHYISRQKQLRILQNTYSSTKKGGNYGSSEEQLQTVMKEISNEVELFLFFFFFFLKTQLSWLTISFRQVVLKSFSVDFSHICNQTLSLFSITKSRLFSEKKNFFQAN